MKKKLKSLSTFSEEKRNIEDFEMFLEKNSERIFYKSPDYVRSLCKSRFSDEDTFFNIGTVSPRLETQLGGVQALFEATGDDMSWEPRKNAQLPSNLTQDLVNRLPYVPFTSGKYFLENDYQLNLGKSGSISMDYHVLWFTPKADTFCPFRTIMIHGISNWNQNTGRVFFSPLATVIADFSSDTDQGGYGFSSHSFVAPNGATLAGPTVSDYMFGSSSFGIEPTMSRVLTTYNGKSRSFMIYSPTEYRNVSYRDGGPIDSASMNGLGVSNGYIEYAIRDAALVYDGPNKYSAFDTQNDPENGFYARFLLDGFRDSKEITVYWCRLRNDGACDYVPTSTNKSKFTTYLMFNPEGYNNFNTERTNLMLNNGSHTDPAKLKQYLIENSFPSVLLSPKESVVYETNAATVELKSQNGDLFFETVAKSSAVNGRCSFTIEGPFIFASSTITTTPKTYSIDKTGTKELQITLVLNDTSVKSMSCITINIKPKDPSLKNFNYEVVSHIQSFDNYDV